MPTNTIKNLHEQRNALVEEARKVLDRAEAEERALTAEDNQELDRLERDTTELEARLKDLRQLDERRRNLDEQRAQYERTVRPQDRVGDPEQEFEERVRAFLRGCGPDATEWAPARIDFKITGKDKAPFHEQRDLTKVVPAGGGFIVPTGFIPRLYEHLVENAAVRQTNAIVYTTDSGEDLLVPKTLTHGSAALVAEAAAIPESDPTFGQATLNAYKYGVLIQVSNELATDSGIDLLSYLARASGLSIGLASGTHFVTGTGTGQPQGVSVAATVGKTGLTGQTTTVISDDLVDLYHSIVSGYRGRGFWLMNDSSLAKVRKLKDSTGQFLWQPGLVLGQPDLLLGRPVVTDPNVAVMAANAKSILFGDFSAFYAIRDVSGVRFQRSDDFAFANDLITFRALIRTDGKALDLTAVKAYQNSAT